MATNNENSKVDAAIMVTKRTKVLFTGGCGFICSNLINEYQRRYPDHFIVNVDKMSYVSREDYIEEELRKDPSRYRFHRMNIVDYKGMRQLFQEYGGFQLIFHLCAESHVDRSFGNSFEFTNSNVFGTHVLLECALEFRSQLQLFLHCSTDEVFGGDADQADENTIHNPSSPYSASKVAAEAFVNAYRLSYQLPTIITRMNNVIGPNQYPEKIIPKFSLALLRGEPITVHGQGTSKRSFMWVGDAVDAFLLLVEKGVIGEVYNVGVTPFEEWSVMEVIDRLRLLIPGSSSEILFVEDRPFNDPRYSMNSAKICALGWKQRVSFEDALKSSVDWLIQNQHLFPKDCLSSQLHSSPPKPSAEQQGEQEH